MPINNIDEAIQTLILYTGDDIHRASLKKTPTRLKNAYKEYFSGYAQDALKVLTDGRKKCHFTDKAVENSMICLKNISFFSHCEHHLAPIIGTVCVAYIPYEHLAGLSKIVRVIDIHAKRLQSQERLTQEICDILTKGLQTIGVAVFIEAEHFCMKTRGIKRNGITTTTLHTSGSFQESVNLRLEFLQSIKK